MSCGCGATSILDGFICCYRVLYSNVAGKFTWVEQRSYDRIPINKCIPHLSKADSKEKLALSWIILVCRSWSITECFFSGGDVRCWYGDFINTSAITQHLKAWCTIFCLGSRGPLRTLCPDLKFSHKNIGICMVCSHFRHHHHHLFVAFVCTAVCCYCLLAVGVGDVQFS